MPKIKTGEYISWREFFKRWKQGMQGITQLQQVKMQIQSMWIIIIGLLAGITISLFSIKSLWWLLIILFGGLYNTVIQMIGMIQRKNQLYMFEEFQKEVIKNV